MCVCSHLLTFDPSLPALRKFLSTKINTTLPSLLAFSLLPLLPSLSPPSVHLFYSSFLFNPFSILHFPVSTFFSSYSPLLLFRSSWFWLSPPFPSYLTLTAFYQLDVRLLHSDLPLTSSSCFSYFTSVLEDRLKKDRHRQIVKRSCVYGGATNIVMEDRCNSMFGVL